MTSEAELQTETESGMPLAAFLHDVQRLYDLGCAAIRNDSYDEAVDCLSKALDMQAQHYGEMSIECAQTFYKLGCAYLYKGQVETDALGDMQSNSKGKQPESSSAEGSRPPDDDDSEDDGGENTQEDGQGPEEEMGEEVEDDDLEAAWKMLDIARVIYERQPLRTLAEVDVLSTLADVSLERESFEACFEDYEKALLTLDNLVEADSRRIAELCFKISLAKQLDQRPKEALEYCTRAASVCERRVERLNKELATLRVLKSESNGTEKVADEKCIVGSLDSQGNAAQTKEEKVVEEVMVGSINGEGNAAQTKEERLVEEVMVGSVDGEGNAAQTMGEKMVEEELTVGSVDGEPNPAQTKGEKMVEEEVIVGSIDGVGNAALTEGSLEAELKEEVSDIEELLVDLKEKVEELKQMATGPSLLEALKATQPEAAALVTQVFNRTANVVLDVAGNDGSSSAGPPGTTSSPTSGPSAIISTSRLTTILPATSASPTNTSSSTGLVFSSATSAANTTTNVSVVGRGVKRAAPTPVLEDPLQPPDVQRMKKAADGEVNVVNSGEPI